MVVRWVGRAVLIWVLSLVAVLALVDFGARIVTQYVVAREIQVSLSLTERPKVSIGGWPFMTELIAGKISSMGVVAHGAITSEGFPADSVQVDMRDVGFSFGDLLEGSGQTVEAESGEGTMTMTEDDVNAAVPGDLGVTVDLKDGKVLLRSDEVKGSIEANVKISGGDLVLTTDQLPAIRLALPAIADGLTFTGVTVSDGMAVLSFDLKDATFQT
jgi:LmeA-like phospholipid-binding